MAHTEAHAAEAHAHDHAPTAFIWKYVFSKDHKVIGIQYYVTAMMMALIAGLLAMLIRVQLAWPEVNWGLIGKLLPMGFQGGAGQPYVMNPEFYAMLFTMHGTIMVFFVLSTAPVSGFGNLLIPLQVGARDMAFPFLNGLSFWTFFCGCVTILTSFFVGAGAAAGGWTSYPPLSALRGAVPGSQIGQTFWIIAMVFFIASFTMGGLNFVTTIINLRTKALLLRMPHPVVDVFLVAILGLLAFPPSPAPPDAAPRPPLRHESSSPPSRPQQRRWWGERAVRHQGGSPLLWQHLLVLGHPEVYILMLPALGFTSDILTTFCRKALFGYKAMVGAMVAISGLSFIVWGHHMFVSGMNPHLAMAFAVGTILIAVPSAVKVFNWLATLWQSRISTRRRCSGGWASSRSSSAAASPACGWARALPTSSSTTPSSWSRTST